MFQRFTALRDEEGFTLIELMVVLLILGILIGLGTPAFLGVKGRFQDRAAESKVRDAVLAARILYTDNATYSNANATGGQLDQIDPSQCWVDGTTQAVATGATCVSGSGTASTSVLGTGSPNRFSAAKMSASQRCFLIVDSLSGTFYGITSTPGDCTATYAASGALTATSPTAAGW